MKRILLLLLVFCLLLGGCSLPVKEEEKRYTATFLDLFDTVTTIIGRGESEAAFREKAQAIHDTLTLEETNMVPATLMKRHSDITVYCDADSAAMVPQQTLDRYCR